MIGEGLQNRFQSSIYDEHSHNSLVRLDIHKKKNKTALRLESVVEERTVTE